MLLQIEGIEFLGMSFNRYELGGGAAKVFGTNKGIEFLDSVLTPLDLGQAGFSGFMRGKHLVVMVQSILKQVKDVPGMERAYAAMVEEQERQQGEEGGTTPAHGLSQRLAKSKATRDDIRSQISAYLRGEFNKFRHKPLMTLPPGRNWKQVMDEMGVELVVPAGMSIEAISGSGVGSRKRKRDEDKAIYAAMTQNPPGIFMRRVISGDGDDGEDGDRSEGGGEIGAVTDITG